MAMSAEVRFALIMVRFTPLPITAPLPPETVISPEEILPIVRAFCLLLNMFQSPVERKPLVVPLAWAIEPESSLFDRVNVNGAVPVAKIKRFA